nr:Coenzyme F420 hydrogenase/dehydrogenase, beta subunit C-terminal domain [Candidatus Njordarchaeota archaeon]
MASNGEATYKESISNAQKMLKGRKENFARLQREVLNTGACVSCGACVASCDQLAFEDGKPKLIGKCTVCGVCYNQCPRTATAPVEQIGTYIAAYTGKTKLDKVRGQDGGIVTSLLLYALKNKMIDAAVVTLNDAEQHWKPVAKLVTSEADILKSSGSIYSHSQVVPALSNAIRSGYRLIAFVGTPCKIDAVYKMQNSPAGLLHLFKGANVLRIGLFCMDSFSLNGLRAFFEEKNNIPLANITKMNIKEGKFRVTLWNNGEKEWPIGDLDSYRSSSCDFCADLTSEKADLSVGSIGSQMGFSTIIVRTNAGMELLNKAAKDGYVEIKPLSEEDLMKVLNIGRAKKNHRYVSREAPVYVLETPPIKLEDFVVSESLPAKPVIKSGDVELLGEGQSKIRVSLRNDTVDCLENLKVRIIHFGGTPESIVTWEIPINEWLSSGTLRFEYPRVKEEKEYVFEVQNKQGDTIFMKKISTADLTKKQA